MKALFAGSRRIPWHVLLLFVLPSLVASENEGGSFPLVAPSRKKGRRKGIRNNNRVLEDLIPPDLFLPASHNSGSEGKGKAGKGGSLAEKAAEVKCIKKGGKGKAGSPKKEAEVKATTSTAGKAGMGRKLQTKMPAPVKTKMPASPAAEVVTLAAPSPADLWYCPDDAAGDAVPSPPTLSPQPVSAESVRCTVIGDGNGSTYYPWIRHKVDFVFLLNGDKAETLQLIQDFLQRLVAPILAGCSDRRRLQEAVIQNVIFKVEEDTVSAKPGTCPDCTNVDVNAQVYYFGDDTSGLEKEIYDTMVAACPQLASLRGVAAIFTPCTDLQVIKVDEGDGRQGDVSGGDGSGGDGSGGDDTGGDGTGGDGTDGTGDGDGENGDGTGGDDEADDNDGGNKTVTGIGVEETSTDKGLSAGGLVGIVLGALILLLFMLLFAARRRRRDDDDRSLKHQKLEDLADDMEVATNSTGSMSPRRTHVVGEDDSMMSGWTGYTPERSGERKKNPYYFNQGMDHSLSEQYSNQDVHLCSSATCEQCELRRQAGLQFVPTGMPNHTNTPYPGDASRDYVATDTVQL